MNYAAAIYTLENKAFVAARKKMCNGDEPPDIEGAGYVGLKTPLQAIERHAVPSPRS